MAIRLSGIASGLDTDSMVKELVSAYSIKKQKYDKQLQKQEWIMSKWSDVNKKYTDLRRHIIFYEIIRRIRS